MILRLLPKLLMIKIPTIIPVSKAVIFAKKIAPTLKGGEILALTGNLGSGKTTFTQALGKALGVTQSIASPTFVLMQEFKTKVKAKDSSRTVFLYHLDLYRTHSFSEVIGLGITEWWGHPETITVIEWAEKIKTHLPKNTTYINFKRDTHAEN